MLTVYPISFSIPETKIIKYVPRKTKHFAHIIPGVSSTYIYKDEATYYKDYQISLFGKTRKKAGWDCMRHYEILANGCIPYFHNLSAAPPTIMTHLPKELIMESMNSPTPEKYIGSLLDYTRKYLTTRAMIKYILSKINKPVNNVLFLSGSIKSDYMRDLTLIGLKETFGLNCTEDIHIPFIYTDFTGNMSGFWGKGFSFSKIIDPNLKNTSFSMEKLQKKEYDLIIYGSAHRGLPYLEEVRKIYDKSSVVFICGEDAHPMHTCLAIIHGKEGYHAFIRELIT